MKKKLHVCLATFVLLCNFCQRATAQLRSDKHHRHIPSFQKLKQKEANAVSGQGANVDVVYQRCTWRVNPDSPSVAAPASFLRGNVTTRFVTQTDNVLEITFDFLNVHTIDSVKYHGSRLPVSNITWPSPEILSLKFPSAIVSKGTLDSITVFYHGNPPEVWKTHEGFGYVTEKDAVSGANCVWTTSEPYNDRDWWPCKHDMTDKIDSMDIIVSVPKAYWVATSGKLVDSAISGASRVFKFSHRYPIASYLVSLNVGKYKTFYRGTVNIDNTQVPVVYNLYQGRTSTEYDKILAALDKNKDVLSYFNNRFGPYPFKNEKHGFYEFGVPGGMEHQAFSGIGTYSLTSWWTLAHELGHQWFGDKVTCSSWHDLWLNEGFATYSEIVASEVLASQFYIDPETGTYINFEANKAFYKDEARTGAAYPLYVDDISSSNSVFGTEQSYYGLYMRGCMAVSMLRALLGNDRFFKACREYLNDPQLAYKSASTADVQRHFENNFGGDLSHFFTAWVYGTGNPDYTVKWNNTGNKINLELIQTRNAEATVNHFPMPVVLTIRNRQFGGTIPEYKLVLYDRGDSVFVAGDGIKQSTGVAGNTISVDLPFTPNYVYVDKGNVTMANGTAIKEESALIAPVQNNTEIITGNPSVYPNPADKEFTFSRTSAAQPGTLILLDMSGKIILRQTVNNAIEKINTSALKSGIYILQFAENGIITRTERVVVAH